MEVIRHPDHDFIYNADIALLHLQHQVRTNDFIRKACIPQQSQLLTSGLICYISGWGVTRIEGWISYKFQNNLMKKMFMAVDLHSFKLLYVEFYVFKTKD